MSFLLPPRPPSFAAALRDVTAKSQSARLAAAERLGQAGAGELDEAIAALSAISGDREAIVRVAGIRALGELAAQRRAELPEGGGEALAQLLDERLRDSSSHVREVAAIALGQLGGHACHRVLERALHSEHPEVRFQALAGYVESSDGAEPRKVIGFLSDPDPEVRGQAARALACIASGPSSGRAAVVSALKAVLSDAASRTRCEAALALARLGDAAGSQELAAALDDATLRGEALEAIASLELRGYGDAIFRIARNVFTSPFDRMAIARTLVKLGDGRGKELLRAALDGLRSAPRVLAVQAIGELGLLELAPQLAKLAERSRGVDAATLTEALGALADSSAEARGALERLAGTSGRVAELALAELNRRSAPVSAPSPQ